MFSDEIRKTIMSAIRDQSMRNFPKVNGTAFNPNYFKGQKKNGEYYQREWMAYSETSDSLFCIHCCLFSASNVSGFKTSWANWGKNNQGFSDFSHLYRAVRTHEESLHHMECTKKWILQKQMLNRTASSSTTVQMLNIQTNEWCSILKGIIDAILFLAKNNLAFRGSSDNFRDTNCGNFLSLINLLSKYYAPLALHLERLNKNNISYLSPEIQNDFIDVCGSIVRSKIMKSVKNQKYFSIMFDSTPDTSHQDQLSQIIRSVNCSSNGCEIQEHFIDFIATTAKTGKDLADVICEKLEADGLDLNNCRGQGYDNGANMSGICNGVQKRILDKCPTAKYIACAAHSLNLVGVNATEHVSVAKLLLGQVQNIFVYFSSSTSRWDILKSKTKRTLKGHSGTRWSSRADAVSSLFDQFENVVEALSIICDSSLSSDSIAGANSRLNDMLNFKFVLGLCIWNRILAQINYCNLELQKKDIAVDRACKHLKILLTWLEEFNTQGYELCYQEAMEKAFLLEIPETSGFEDVRKRRGLNRKYMADAEFSEVASLTNKQRFEKEFFNKIMASLQLEMSKRFKAFQESWETFSFLWGQELLSNDLLVKKQKITNLCKLYSDDFDQAKFNNEIQILLCTLECFKDENVDFLDLTPLDVLNIIYKNGLECTFTNIETAIRIFLTLPVSVASNERGFSKLKIIKNHLRSSMGQTRLTNLAILSIERKHTEAIDFSEIIAKFAASKTRKVNFK